MSRSAWTDRNILEVLHLMDNTDMTATDVAIHMSKIMGQSLTRNSILGVVHRVKVATDKVDVSPHLNGSMSERWWA